MGQITARFSCPHFLLSFLPPVIKRVLCPRPFSLSFSRRKMVPPNAFDKLLERKGGGGKSRTKKLKKVGEPRLLFTLVRFFLYTPLSRALYLRPKISGKMMSVPPPLVQYVVICGDLRKSPAHICACKYVDTYGAKKACRRMFPVRPEYT